MSGITIAGSYNARWSDPAAGGAHRLARAAALDAIGTAGAAQLATLGLTLVVDLREDGERGETQHGIPVVSVPLYRLPDGPPLTGSLERVYDFLLRERGDELATAVAAIATAPGPVLVHCTAGKDRTGLVVALALLAAGHSEADVVADYARSAGVVRARRAEHAHTVLAGLGLTDEDHRDSLRLHLDSPPAAMEHVLRTLRAEGGAEACLRRHGLTEDHLQALRHTLGAAARA